MPQFPLYDFVSRARWLNYRGKIMLMAFAGTHIPLLALIGYTAFRRGPDFWTAVSVLVVALVATLVGTGVTLFVLDQLLRPITATARGLRRYRQERLLPVLPTHYTDEAGTLMADASQTLVELDRAIDELAHYDKITGLANRDGMLAELRRRVAGGRPFVLAAMRLNGYDRLAETFDQTTADRVVRRLADGIRTLADERAFVARIDGGVFSGAFAPGDGDIGALFQRIETAINALRREIVVGPVSIIPDLTAGVALFPQDGDDPALLLDNAVAAAAQSGDSDVHPVQFFSPTVRAAARERFLTEQELRRAVSNGELRLHYQPVVDTGLGRIVGAEALVRWQHPERGLVLPGRFISIAEASGLIDPIGRWVLETATDQLGDWARAGRDDLKVAVNLSARQFRDPGMIEAIGRAVRAKSIAAGRLEVELTETTAMQDRERAARLFKTLRDLGVTIAIDDFGTGYSSMANLLDLPFDLLKIDRQFVTGVDRAKKAHAICSALIALAQNLDTGVLAEGVETGAEVDALVAMGIRRFQGFFFARPMTADDFFRFANDLGITAHMMAGKGFSATDGAAARKTG